MSDEEGAAAGPLEQKLIEMRAKAAELMPADSLKKIRGCIESMKKREDCPGGLARGAPVPDFVLSETWGAQFWLKEALEQGPVIVVFYRGTWCSYCLVTLAAWQESLAAAHAAGAQVVAISPQYPEATGELVKKLGLEFPVLCDPGNRVARKFGVVCKQVQPLQSVNEMAGADLQQANKDCSQELPLPGTFLIGQGGALVYSHADFDFTQRAEPTYVIARLKGIAS